MRAARLALAPLFFAACVGETGGNAVVFTAAAAGPADATAGQPLSWSMNGFDVALTEATLHVGAIYLDEAAPVSGAQATGCYLTGTYVAQETSALDVDLLSPTPQPFPQRAVGITEPAPLVGQVWLTGGDVNQVADTTAILKIAGTATQGGASFPFTGALTIGANRAPAGGGTGGGNSICKQRIVTPISVSLTLATTGGLLLRIDPRLFFTGVAFSQLPSGSAGGYAFSDDPAAPGYVPTGQALYSNLHSTAPYEFGWTNMF
jgi:hypothetical protein